jgi:SPFH domain/Band 7 family protein
MLIKYFKGEPNAHILRYRGGAVVQDGPGLAFFYMAYNTSIAVVPTATQAAHFIFNEATRDFQSIAIQGNLAYRLATPLDAARSLDFTIDLKTKGYRSKDPEKLAQRLIDIIQANTRADVIGLSLEEALIRVRDLAANVLVNVRQEPVLATFGVVVEGLHFTSVAATPEMKKALEAEHREALQQRADQAIYARRANAVEEERRIKQREMDTEIELENRRKDLVDTQARNRIALAEADAKAEELKLRVYGGLAPQVLAGVALKDWAAAGGRIGNLTITPDMLAQLGAWIASGKKPAGES